MSEGNKGDKKSNVSSFASKYNKEQKTVWNRDITNRPDKETSGEKCIVGQAMEESLTTLHTSTAAGTVIDMLGSFRCPPDNLSCTRMSRIVRVRRNPPHTSAAKLYS